MKTYYISLYPGPHYFRHFIVQESSPERALNKLNYQARQQLKALQQQYPNDEYQKCTRAKSVIKATRRWEKRKY